MTDLNRTPNIMVEPGQRGTTNVPDTSAPARQRPGC